MSNDSGECISRTDIRHTRDSSIDLMKTAAAFFVVLIHSSYLNQTASAFFVSISGFSVPAFVIISGYCMLSERTDTFWLFRKSARLFCLMIVWSAIFYVYLLASGSRAYEGWRSLLGFLLTEPVHLWYLYAAIWLYILTPLLNVFFKNASQKEYLYALALTFLFGSIINFAVRSGYFPNLSGVVYKMKADTTSGFLFCYLCGGYFKKYGVRRPAVLCALGAAGTAVTLAGTLLIFPGNDAVYGLMMNFFAPGILAASVGYFALVRQICLRHPVRGERAAGLLKDAAGLTLGVYLFHPMLILTIQRHDEALKLLSPWIATPLIAVFVFLVSMAVIFVIKKIPGLRMLAA